MYWFALCLVLFMRHTRVSLKNPPLQHLTPEPLLICPIPPRPSCSAIFVIPTSWLILQWPSSKASPPYTTFSPRRYINGERRPALWQAILTLTPFSQLILRRIWIQVALPQPCLLMNRLPTSLSHVLLRCAKYPQSGERDRQRKSFD